MTSGSQSKAQRRAENQRRAEERRRAEQRKKQMRIGLWGLGGVAVVALVVMLIVTLTGGGSDLPPTSRTLTCPSRPSPLP